MIHRRDFVKRLALGAGASLSMVPLERLKAQEDTPDKPAATSRITIVEDSVLGVPKWDLTIRVPGFVVIATAKRPKSTVSFLSSVYPQVFRKDWEFIPVNPAFKNGGYTSPRGFVRDTVRIQGTEANVLFFIPNVVLSLQPGKFKFRFLLLTGSQQNGHEVALRDLDTYTSDYNIEVTRNLAKIVRHVNIKTQPGKETP